MPGPQGAIVLFETSPQHGHWLGVFQQPDGICVWDPYGGALDSFFSWTSAAEERRLGQRPFLTSLVQDARRRGVKVRVNRVAYQAEGPDVSTCGRWVALRLLLAWLPERAFTRMLAASGVPADAFATIAVGLLLNK